MFNYQLNYQQSMYNYFNYLQNILILLDSFLIKLKEESVDCYSELLVYEKAAATIAYSITDPFMFERNENLMDYLETDQVDRLERLLEEQAEASVDISQIKSEQDAIKKEMKSADKDAKAELQIKLKVLDEKIQARKDQKQESRESIRRPIDPYEAFITGAELSHRMSIKNATDEEAGLFISALIRFAAEPRFGGHANHNCGLVEANWTVTTWKPGELVPVTLGEISITPNGVNIKGDELTAMVKAFNDNQSFDFTTR